MTDQEYKKKKKEVIKYAIANRQDVTDIRIWYGQEWANDEDVALVCVKNNGYSFRDLNAKNRDNEKIAIAAIKGDVCSYQYASFRLRQKISIGNLVMDIEPDYYPKLDIKLRFNKKIT